MKLFLRLFGGVLLALMLVACHGSGRTDDATPSMQLKTYHVPPQVSSSLANNLFDVFANRDSHVSVSQPFPGTLLVYAPRDTQASIASAVDALVKGSGKMMVPAQLQVHFWVVDAIKGHGRDDPALKPLDEALGRVRASLGPSHFTVDKAVAAGGMLGQKGEIVTDDKSNFKFAANPGPGEAINLRVEYASFRESDIRQLQTTVAVTPGQYVVLAQAPTAPSTGTPSSAPPAGATPAMRLIVVRVDRVAPAPR